MSLKSLKESLKSSKKIKFAQYYILKEVYITKLCAVSVKIKFKLLAQKMMLSFLIGHQLHSTLGKEHVLKYALHVNKDMVVKANPSNAMYANGGCIQKVSPKSSMESIWKILLLLATNYSTTHVIVNSITFVYYNILIV